MAIVAIDVHGVVGGSSCGSWLKDVEGGEIGFISGKPIISSGYIGSHAIYPCGIGAVCIGGFAGIVEEARLNGIKLCAVEGGTAYKPEICSGFPVQKFLFAYGRAVVLVSLIEIAVCVPGVVCIIKRR